MKLKALFSIVCALLLAGAVSSTAFAHGRVYGGVGIGIGVPVWGGPYYRPWYPYYPRPYYYDQFWAPPPVVVVPAAPPVYIEQPVAPVVSEPAQQYWYYCAPPRAYYPYIKDCPSGWQRVLPQPAQ
jgi:hypothetical protein